MIPAKADVVVIGSGPSGSMAGGLLAKAGFDVVILDRETHPRPRIGENIIPDFWKYADLLGATPAVEMEQFIAKAGGMVNWKNKLTVMNFASHGYDRPALHAEREIFDHILSKQAQNLGSQLFEDVTVSQIKLDQHKVIYRHHDTMGQITARYIVDASGQNAILSRQLGLRKLNPNFRFMSVWGYFTGSRYYGFDQNIYTHDQVRQIPPVTYQMSLAKTDHIGWAWHIPLREKTSVGFILPLEWIKDLKTRYDNWQDSYLALVNDVPSLQTLLNDATLIDNQVYIINNYSAYSTQVAGDGFFMVGDAAGFIDPVFSVGVTLGMYNGALAARTIEQCIKKPHRIADYQTMYSNQLYDRLATAKVLALPEDAVFVPERNSQMITSHFMSEKELNLTKTVAEMSDRSKNFKLLF